MRLALLRTDSIQNAVPRQEGEEHMMKHSSGRFLTIAAALALAIATLAGPAQAQQVLTNGPPAVIKIGDDAWLKFGVLLQPTADWLENAEGGNAETMYLRRARFIAAGQIYKDLTFFFQTDSPNFYKATTAEGVVTKTNNLLLQDALLEWKVAGDHFMIDAGEMLVVVHREAITSVATFLAIDVATVSGLYSAPTQSNAFRDTGFAAKGYLIGDGHLEYLFGVYDGIRQLGLQNAYRYSGFLMYNFFEVEKGYVVQGTYLGQKKVANISVGSDNQNNYHMYTATAMTALPLNGGDELGFQYQFQHLDGENYITTLKRQNTSFGELGYYIHGIKTGPFVKYEQQTFSDASQTVNNLKRYGGGLNFYPHGTQNLKVSGQFLRVVPANATAPDTNEVTIQLQAYLF